MRRNCSPALAAPSRIVRGSQAISRLFSKMPSRSWMVRNVEMNDFTPLVQEDDKTVKITKRRRAERQSFQNPAKAIQNSRSRKCREGRLAVRLRMASCWRRARISAISSSRGAKRERVKEKRRGKRAINERQDH
jgi:hypothetical protein